jgi:pimeloyl-ACP methyl ester carboxylesterase
VVVRQPRRIVILVAVVIGFVLVTGLAYLGAGFVLYDQISRVKSGCANRFATVTPANLDYHLADDDLAGALVMRFPLATYRMPEYQEVSFPSRPDEHFPSVTIRAWWIPGTTTDAPAVILVHGRHSCRKDWNVLIPAGMLHRAGFATLAIDLRNQGASDSAKGRRGGATTAGSSNTGMSSAPGTGSSSSTA